MEEAVLLAVKTEEEPRRQKGGASRSWKRLETTLWSLVQ